MDGYVFAEVGQSGHLEQMQQELARVMGLLGFILPFCFS
jgi:hypothetical protein